MEYIKRELEDKVGRWLDEREIIAIRGPRQSGKTTLLNRIEKKLEKKGVEEGKIHQFSFEDELAKLKFEKNPKEFIEFELGKGKHYFLLDEVQYVKNIGKKLKLIFDSYENVKLIITGSSSFEMTNLAPYLVGRVIFFNLYPFSFLEFLRSKEKKYEKKYKELKTDIFNKRIGLKESIFTSDLNKLLHEYLTFGAYPRVVLEKNKKIKKEILKNLFTTYVERDVVGQYGIKYREKVVKLLKSISSIMGDAINYQTLSESSGLKYNEVRDILPLLEDTFVISLVRPFHKNLNTELRKNPKIYFVDCGFRNYLLENFDNLDYSSLYENFVFNQLREFEPKYWRTTSKTEVDFVIKKGEEIIPIEVKTKPKITRSLRSFIGNYNPKKVFISNLKNIEKKKIDNARIYILPHVYL